MNIFINCESELDRLEGQYAVESGRLVVLYARRRLGKTSLLRKFTADKPHCYFMADCAGEPDLRRSLVRAIHIPEAFADCVKVQPATVFTGKRETWAKLGFLSELNRIYRLVRSESEWFAVLDADEFIAARKNPEKPEVQVLRENFSDCDCVMMPCGG